MQKIIIGLTGGIASGKSAVADIFASLGAYIIDADVISRKIMGKDSPVLIDVENAFPGTVTNGVLDRKKLKNMAFRDENSTKLLNLITHTAIFKEMNDQILSAPLGVVVLVVPLMFETGANKLCEIVVTVSCPEKKRIERLIKRDNINEELALNIISRQLSDDERSKKADYVINNDRSLDDLRRKAEELYGKIKA